MARTTTARTVSARAIVLAEGFLGRMLMLRIKKTAVAAMMVVGCATAGALALQTQPEKPTPASAPASDARQEILDQMHAWVKAVAECDVGTMDRVLAYELIGTDPTGSLWDKAKYLDHVKRNAFKVMSADFRETRIDVYGDAAVETGVAHSEIKGQQPYIKERGYIEEKLTRTWIKRNGVWQCVAYQTMVIATHEYNDHPKSAGASKADARPRALTDDKIQAETVREIEPASGTAARKQ
jgi:hypothetical protein